MIREAEQKDLDELLKLYLFLHEDSIPENNEHLRNTWTRIFFQPFEVREWFPMISSQPCFFSHVVCSYSTIIDTIDMFSSFNRVFFKHCQA